MNISKKDALEWFEFLSTVPGNKEEVCEEYKDVIESILRQIDLSMRNHHKNLQSKVTKMDTLKGRTFFVGDKNKFPKGCVSCLFGDGLGGVRKTNKCNLKCKFCYYHDNIDNQEAVPDQMWEIGDTLYYEEDIDFLLDVQKKPSGIAYVYLEPFLEIEKYFTVIEKFKNAGVYQHMYTNGTLGTEEDLKRLGEAGLNEIRFNLGASNCSDKVIEFMRLAKKYIPMVGIETPMTPEFFKSFMEKKDLILSTGLDFINCAELHFGEDNLNNYQGEVMYISRRGYISPVWSREITLELMRMASEENWPIVVHDCSNHTKYSRELNKNSKQNHQFGFHTYYSEFDRILFHLFIPFLQDDRYPFIIEEELSEKYKLENCKDDILELCEEEEEEIYEGFYDYQEEEENI
ncbi:MAG: radical SAM protein [Cetobacterium sp.]